MPTKRTNQPYQRTPVAKRNRAARNAARHTAMRAGAAKKGDGKDVHHVTPLAKKRVTVSKGRIKGAGATRVVSRSYNRKRNARKK